MRDSAEIMFPRGNRIETPSLSACGGGYAPDLIDESRSAAFRTSFSMMPLQRRSAGAAFFLHVRIDPAP